MEPRISLNELAATVEDAQVIHGTGAEKPSGLAYESRRVEPGFLFIAVPGERFDGHGFIPQVIEAGAGAVVVQADRAGQFAGLSVPQIVVPDARRAMAPLACAFYGNPTHRLYLAGVTGTNGKTTTTRMIDAIAQAAGDVTGTIGTLGATVAGKDLPGERTTPEAPDLQELFAQMLAAGATSAAMEVASHALVLGRVEGCAFDVGVFTNLTQDHLDFHGTMESYRDAKGMLFTHYADLARAADKNFTTVLNIDDDAGLHYTKQLSEDDEVIWYTTDPSEHWKGGAYTVFAETIQTYVDRITYTAKTPLGDIPIEIGFGGNFNVANSLAAIGYGVARGLTPEVIAAGLKNCPPVPGRFQPVRTGQDFAVLVDYAHTPDGIENVLKSARPLTQGRLIVVFGCGGNRDKTKRPKMGKLALDLADVAVVTSDNPRREEPEAIIDDILAGMQGPGATVHRESDRRKAIALAVGMAKPGDVMVIAGKGHENYQIVGDQTFPFDDVQVAGEEIKQCSAV